MSLKTDYVDAVYTGDKAYTITENGDGTSKITDSTTYSQTGSSFGAKDINETNTEVNRVALELETAQKDIENKAPSDHTHTAEEVGAAASEHKHAAGDINSGTLPVVRGGTGVATMTSGAAMIGNGTGAPTFRSITNLTAKGAASASTNLATANTVVYHSQARLNRTTNVNAADTGYTTYMARAIALVTAVPTSMVNGAVAFVYS